MTYRIMQLDPVQMTPYYNSDLCGGLTQLGHEVVYVTSQSLYDRSFAEHRPHRVVYAYFRHLDLPWLQKVPRLRQVLRGLAYPLGHQRVLRLVKRLKPDVVHIQWSRLPWIDIQLVKQIRKAGIPVVHTVHDVIPLYERGGTHRQLEALYATADALIVHAEANRRDLLARFPSIRPSRVRVMPMIATESPRTSKSETQSEARRRLDIDENDPTIALIGTIKQYKGLDVLGEALPQVWKAAPATNVLIAGPTSDRQQSELVKMLARDHRVHVYNRYIPYEDMWIYHLAADLVVFPYHHIYQSAALTTAMVFARPVVVSDVGGLAELVDGNGWIVKPENPTALGQTIVEALSNRKLLTTMGRRSRQLIDERHTPLAAARKHAELYSALLAGNLA